jgi:hypothetical protein
MAIKRANKSRSFLAEMWNSYRPYGIKVGIDFLVADTVWLGLFLFQRLRHFLPIPGWGGTFIDNLHSLGTVLVFLSFTLLSAVDIFNIRKESRE